MSEPLHEAFHHHHIDYFPLRIRVFKNGDMYDPGHILAVTRKQFKHWIVFLDALTALLDTATAVRKLFSIQGMPIQHFDELETNGEYVAVENGPFIAVPYGQTRFTMRGKRYNPIIRIPEMVPTFLNSAESMDIYLKKEGYGTITGLPYPFDGILTRSPSASQLQIKHLQSHIPPLKIGGSMEHLNELGGAASWLGKNEKWMMGERVRADGVAMAMDMANKDKESSNLENSSDETQPQQHQNHKSGSQNQNQIQIHVQQASQENQNDSSHREKQRLPTKLPRLSNSTSSSRRGGAGGGGGGNPSQKLAMDVMMESLPRIDIDKDKKQNKQQQTISESKTTTSRVVSRKTVPAPKKEQKEDDEIRYHRSYQMTETTYVKNGKNQKEEEEEQQGAEEDQEESEDAPEAPEAPEDLNLWQTAVEDEEEVPVMIQIQNPNPNSNSNPNANPMPAKRERAKWKDGSNINTNRTVTVVKKPPEGPKPQASKKNLTLSENPNLHLNLKELKNADTNSKKPKIKDQPPEKAAAPALTEKSQQQKEKKADVDIDYLAKWDVDTNEIPRRFDGVGIGIGIGGGGGASKMVTSRSSVHLFVDEIIGDEIDDVIARAKLWENNKKQQKMRQQCTQTTSSLRSISVPRNPIQFFDPDFD